jgi:hypothetical protein
VKNYNIDIVVENQPRQVPVGHTTFGWDEEVEIYDIRGELGDVSRVAFLTTDTT